MCLGIIRRGQHIFPECVSEHAFGGWLPTKGELHKLLQKGEYSLIGDAPIFEGTFVQVTKRGEFIGILNHPNIVILGILASTPSMLLPDLMIIARDKQEGQSKSRKLEIARLIPLELVEIYVHNLKERRLKIHMVTGRNYYLQLCAADGEEGVLFERWMRLIYLLHVATGKAKPPSNVSSKDVGLHTIWKTASMPSETQWLPVIMDKGSSGELKKRSSHASSTRTEQKSKQSAVASRQSPPKSGALQPSSQLPSRTIQPQAYTSGAQPQDSVSKDPSKLKSESATKQSEYQMVPQPRRFSTCKPCAHSPPPSRVSVAVETSEFETMSVGVGPSMPFTLSEAVGPSQPASQLGAWASSQSRSPEQPGVLTPRDAVISKDSMATERESLASGDIPIKLEKSQKSRSLVETTGSQASQQKSSQSRSKTPSLKEKSVTEAQVMSQGSSRSGRPVTQGGSGLTSQSSSRKQSQMASRMASARAPSASMAARSCMSEAVGSSDAYTKTVAVGPSEVGAMSVAAGPSQPASRASRVASARSEASRTSAFPVPQPASHESRVTQTRSKVSDNASARMNEKDDGAAGTGPISREMSVKSKPSEKQGTSAAPSRLQSQGRTSAPYSQMAGMNEEPEGDMGSRPISREMSVKSKPSEKQGTSAAPSRLQSPGRTSAPYSQMAGMNEGPEGDMGSRPISRGMSVKSKPSEKQGTSAAPSRLQSPGRTSAPYSQMAGMNEGPEGDMGSRPISRGMSVKSKLSEKQGTSAAPSKPSNQGRTSSPYSQMGGMETQKLSKTKSSKPVMSSGPSQEPGRYTSPSQPGRSGKVWSRLGRKFASVAAGPSEPGLKSVAVGTSQPFSGGQSRPQSRTVDTSKSVKVRTIFSRKKSKSGDKAQSSSATGKQEPLRDQASKSKSRVKNALSSAKQRSSLTFVTIYSVLSSSMERLRGTKSTEDTKLQEEQLENIASKPSKRVTISGVIGPSGKGIQAEDPSEMKINEFSSTAATLGSEPGILSTPQSYAGTSEPTVVASNMEYSASPSRLDQPAPDQMLPSSRPSEKSAFSKQASVNTEVLSPQSKTPVDMGTSTAGANSAVAGPSTSANSREQGQPSVRSGQQSKMEDGWTRSPQPSAAARPPDRSRISVGVGSTIVDIKSEAVGPSARGSLRDEAVGPSTASSWMQQGESRTQSRQQSKMEDRWRPSSQPSALTRPPDRSRVSVGVGRSITKTKSAAVGPSVIGSWKEQRECKMHSRQQSQMDDDWRMSSRPYALPGPPDRSRMSVGVGRSVIETKSVGVGRSQRETVSEGAGPSKAGSKITARNSRAPDTRLQEHSVFQPQGWLGTVEREDTPVSRISAAATPGPSNRASRAMTTSGGLGSRGTRDASARSYS